MVKWLLIVLSCAYVAQLLLVNWLHIPVSGMLALTPGGLGLWQLATYVLVDLGDPIFFALGLLFLWWALTPFERAFGPTRTLQLCLVSTFGASVPVYLVGLAIPSPPLFGASALWFGAIAATTWSQGDRQLSLFGLFSLSARQFLWLVVGLLVLRFLANKDHTQLIAGLGAMGAGIGFVNWLRRPRGRRTPGRRTSARPSPFKVVKGGDDRPKWLN